MSSLRSNSKAVCRKVNLIVWVIMIAALMIAPGCSEKTTAPKGPESGCPFLTKKGEGWQSEDNEIYVFKASGMVQIYLYSKLFGPSLRAQAKFSSTETTITIDTGGEIATFPYIIKDNGQTLLLYYFDEDEYSTFTKIKVNLDNAVPVNLDNGNHSIYVYLRPDYIYIGIEEQEIQEIELKINGKTEPLYFSGESAYAEYPCTEGTEYMISLHIITDQKEYNESTSITIPQQAVMKLLKAEDRWWDSPVQVSWSFKNNKQDSMVAEAYFYVENDEDGEFGFLAPNLRSFTIPKGTFPSAESRRVFSLYFMNYVTTSNTLFIAESYCWIDIPSGESGSDSSMTNKRIPAWRKNTRRSND